MTTSAEQLFVKSHVARDLLQSAGLFKTDKLVVWEYVSNGLQYVDPGVSPDVRVTINSKKKTIGIEDNGRGMSWDDLKNFFLMHGENQDRKAGRGGRGRFGTGKSAAFGIADLMRITTTRDGRESQVELSRSDIESMSSEDPIPVRILKSEEPSGAANGTRVDIEGVHLRSLDQAGIIKYIERHLAHWSRDAVVFVNNHECEYAEPPVASEERFKPEGDAARILGDVDLVVRVSKAPLDEDLRGISIYANGVWHETTLAGSEGRDMAQYIFGEIDVSKLDSDTSPIAPFDVSRSMRLNPNNEIVQAIYSFVGPTVDRIRRGLVAAEKRRRESEIAQKLRKEASEIARVINEDFDDYRQRVAKARARHTGGTDRLVTQAPAGGDGEDLFVHEGRRPLTRRVARPGRRRPPSQAGGAST